VNLGGVSHVGGHVWAGNVIIYTPMEADNALAGTGIWLGRVEPRHVEGIITETILGGQVIGELWRGGIGSDGRVIRI
jgi:(2Fe-2S) ferredoxin